MNKSNEIGLYKEDNNITILQIKRFQQMLKDRVEMGGELGLDNKFVMKLLQLVHKESIQKQFQIMSKNKS